MLQVFDRETFLRGMETRQTQYFSQALLYCVFACAARISDRLPVRALVIPANDDLEDEQPYLIATATRLIEQELKRPQITTIQALLLLSVLHCALSKDTKGWLLTGISNLTSIGQQLIPASQAMRAVWLSTSAFIALASN